MEPPLSSPMESGHITFLASVCDNTYGVLTKREIHPSLKVQFLLGLLYIGMIDRFIAHMVDLSQQVVWHSMTVNNIARFSDVGGPT